MTRPTKLAMIREASRADADGVAWRRRMERWVRLGYSYTSPEQRALARGVVDLFTSFEFVRTKKLVRKLMPRAARKFKGYKFVQSPLLFAKSA